MEIVILLLFAVATVVALLARRLKIPYTVALVVTGVVLGTLHAFEAPHLTQHLLYAVILPGLLFEAAFHLDFSDFWNNKLAIHSLAIVGVVATIFVIASLLAGISAATNLLAPVPFSLGLVFGAVVAATDPIAVVGLFKSLGAPRRLRVLVEGESLLNDGTALVLFTLIVAAVSGGSLSPSGLALDFFRIVGLGVLIGSVTGLVVSTVIARVDDPMIEITLTTIAAYGSFLLAEHFHGSGVIATVSAGLVCGNFALRSGMSATTRIAVETFWEYLAFALNSFVFLLIGFSVPIQSLGEFWGAILIAYLVVTVSRGVVVYSIAALLRPTAEAIPWKWCAVMTWAGLRGALSMVVVLGLGAGFPHRDTIVTITFGVVVLSILVQGLTMSPLLRALGVVTQSELHEEYETRRGRLMAVRAAREQIPRISRELALPAATVDHLQSDYEEQERKSEEQLASLHVEEQQLRDEEIHAARRHLLLVQKEMLIEQFRRGLLGRSSYHSLMASLDARLLAIEDGDEERPEDSEDDPPDR
ncbi:MAG: cation:proton antiporter [Thermoanaerobaculia bacterium]